MAQDMQWPSEDEDFDAITSADKARSINMNHDNQPEKLTAKPVKKPVNKVAVAVSEPEEHQSEAAPQEIEEAFSKPVESREQAEDPEQPEEPAAQPAPEATVSDQPADELPEATTEAAAVESSEEQPPEAVVPTAVSTNSPKTPKDNKAIARAVLEAVLILALIGVGYYAYGLHDKNQDLKTQVSTLKANPQIVIKQQTDDLIAKVGSLISLPKGESPTVANVTDAATARKQSAFFNTAQNGDKVLLYPKAGLAILYRPSTNKIVLQAPLTFNADTTTKAATPTTTTPTTRR